MKRPKLKYDGNTTFIYTYSFELEKYCDELEAIVSKGDCVTHYEKEIERLEKALDKACDVIVELNTCNNLRAEQYEHCPFEKKCFFHDLGCFSNKENWKEWLMKDE